MDIATVSNTDLKKNDKKCVPKNLMSAKVLCDVRNTKLLYGESLEQDFMEFFFWSLKNLIIAIFWKHNNYYFLLKVKDSQENLFRESYFKKWLFKM